MVENLQFLIWVTFLTFQLLDCTLQVLSDDEKRSLYDKYGEAGLKGAGMGMGVSCRKMLILYASNSNNIASTFFFPQGVYLPLGFFPHGRISVIPLISLSHCLKAWAVWVAWAVVELLETGQFKARMRVIISS